MHATHVSRYAKGVRKLLITWCKFHESTLRRFLQPATRTSRTVRNVRHEKTRRNARNTRGLPEASTRRRARAFLILNRSEYETISNLRRNSDRAIADGLGSVDGLRPEHT